MVRLRRHAIRSTRGRRRVALLPENRAQSAAALFVADRVSKSRFAPSVLVVLSPRCFQNASTKTKRALISQGSPSVVHAEIFRIWILTPAGPRARPAHSGGCA